MELIEAQPLQIPYDYDRRNKHFINPKSIIVASFNDGFTEARNWINVKLIDKTEWLIKREDFDKMITGKGD